MKAKQLPALITASLSLGLVACDEFNVAPAAPVPEMPYRPRPVAAPIPEPVNPDPEPTTWETAPAANSYISSAPASRPVTPAPISNPAPTTSATRPVAAIPDPVVNTPAPAPAPAPAPIPEPTSPATVQPLDMTSFSTGATVGAPSSAPEPAPTAVSSAQDLKSITNTGPIPTASPVEGDPTRVWNPLDPSKKIRIINPKTNQPYPSGKKLKVRGTNFQFYVP